MNDIALVFMAGFLGAFSSFFNVLFARRLLRRFEISAYIGGGLLGGIFVAACMLPADEVSRWDVALLALAGYFGADLMHAIVCKRSAR